MGLLATVSLLLVCSLTDTVDALCWFIVHCS